MKSYMNRVREFSCSGVGESLCKGQRMQGARDSTSLRLAKRYFCSGKLFSAFNFLARLPI